MRHGGPPRPWSPPAVVHPRISERTRSRWSSARCWAIIPPIETPMTCADSCPAASRTASASPTRSRMESGPVTASESPVPRLSKTMHSARFAVCGSSRYQALEEPESPMIMSSGSPEPSARQWSQAPSGAVAVAISAALVRGLARPLLQEGPHGVLEVLGAEEAAGRLRDDRVRGPGAAVDLLAHDRLRRGVRPGRALREPPRVRAGRVVEAVVRQDAVDDAPALERRGVVEVAGHHELAGAGWAGALGQALRAAHRRREADDGLDEAEAGGLGGEQQVAAQAELEGRGQAEAVRGEHRRERELLDRVDHRQEVGPQLGRVG